MTPQIYSEQQECQANQGACPLNAEGSKTLRKLVLGNAGTTINLPTEKEERRLQEGFKKPVLWGDDERKGLNILKHMEHERIFSEKGAGLALAMPLKPVRG